MTNKNIHPESIRELKRMIVRRRWYFIIPTATTILCILIGGMFIPRKYEGHAIFERRSDLVMNEIVGRGAPRSYQLLKQSLVEELRGTPAIEKAFDDTNLIARPEDWMPIRQQNELQLERNDLTKWVSRHMRVYFDISSAELDRIHVVYSDSDPQRARVLINRIVSNYIDKTRNHIDDMLHEAATFFKQQAKIYHDKITTLEDNRLRFEIDHAGLLPNNSVTVHQLLTTAEEKLIALERRDKAISDKINHLTSELSEMGDNAPSQVVKSRNPDIPRLEQQLADYETQLENASFIRKMTEKHPTVVSLKAKIDTIAQQLGKTPHEIVSEKVYGENTKQTTLEMALLDAKNNRDLLANELTTAQNRVGQLRAKTALFFPVRAEYRKIEREIEEAQRQLSFWEDNHRRIAMTLAAEMGQCGISLDFIQPCGLIQRPTSPDPFQIFIAAIGIGVIVGISMAMFVDRSDQTIHSVDQASRIIPIPVLGSVAEIISHRRMAARRMLDRIIIPSGMAVMAVALLVAVYMNYANLRWSNVHEKNGPVLTGLEIVDKKTDPSRVEIIE